MTKNNQKEMFSIAFVRAVAATAGYNVYRQEIDDDSIDIGIAARGPIGSVRSPKLDVQLKCTAAGIVADEHLSHQIPMKNYDDLRFSDYQVPRVLVVVSVPADVNQWLAQTDAQLVLCHCGYWISLRGKPEATHIPQENPRVTVHLPRSQPFTVAQLDAIMSRIGQGESI
jgi:Domain of unknown function (DUF4365)